MRCKDALAASCTSDLNLKTTGISDVKMPGFHLQLEQEKGDLDAQTNLQIQFFVGVPVENTSR